MAAMVDKSLCSPTAIAVRIGSAVYRVPRDSATRWVSHNVPDVWWDGVLRAVEEFDRWETERGSDPDGDIGR